MIICGRGLRRAFPEISRTWFIKESRVQRQGTKSREQGSGGRGQKTKAKTGLCLRLENGFAADDTFAGEDVNER
jgi:hypothetical protein